MELSEKLMMFLLFAARIGIPVLVTFGIAYLYDRIAARWENQAELANSDGMMQRGSAMTASHEAAPDETCPICQRAQSACTRWPNVPCWLAMQLVEGQIPDDCLLCRRFTDGDFQTHQLAGA